MKNKNIIQTQKDLKGIPNDIVDIACGSSHTIIMRTNGDLFSCGRNQHGQLGHEDNKNRNRFKKIINIQKN